MKTFTEIVNRASAICVAAQESLGHEEDTQRLVAEGCFVKLTSDGKELEITRSMVRVKVKTNKRQTSSPDTAVAECRVGKPGSKSRLDAYRAFYARAEGNEKSAFTVDLADALASGQERRVARSKYDVTVSLRADRSDSSAE